MQAIDCSIHPCFNSMLGRYDGKTWRCDGCFLNPVRNVKTSKVLDNFFHSVRILNQKMRAERSDNVLMDLRRVPRLANLRTLSLKDKQSVWGAERKNPLSNIGVFECLLKRITVAASHVPSFREPPLPIRVFYKDKELSDEDDYDEVVLPAIPFPEVRLAISSSPSERVHDFLAQRMFLKEGDATLLLGFD